MFTPGRYVVIDDNKAELQVLVDALHQIGTPCVAYHYQPEAAFRDGFLLGVRVLFLDLHLVPGVQMGGHESAYNTIVQLLDSGIDPVSGPYIIVLWSSYADRRAELENRISERLAPEKRPLALLVLDKKDYDLQSASTEGAEKLRQDVSRRIAEDPRLFALLSWERDVLAAAGATLAQIGSLVPEVDRTPERYGEKLDAILSVLAAAAVGKHHVKDDVRAAVNAALIPILSDRILNQKSDAETAAVWEGAVTKYDDQSHVGDASAANINTMLHVALPESETIKPSDWGAVIFIPNDALEDPKVEQRFGLDNKSQLILQLSPLKRKSARKKLVPVLVRVGASCDFAQAKKGPIPYVAGVIVPSEEPLIACDKRQKGEFESPLLTFDDQGPKRLYINASFQVSLVSAEVETWYVVGRIREQLLMQLTAHCAEYVTRPGIVQIPASVTEADADDEEGGDNEPSA